MDALDGNAIAGELVAAFAYEMTTVAGRCTRPGTVARCPGCATVAMVLARGTARVSGYELASPGPGD